MIIAASNTAIIFFFEIGHGACSTRHRAVAAAAVKGLLHQTGAYKRTYDSSCCKCSQRPVGCFYVAYPRRDDCAVVIVSAAPASMKMQR